MHSAPMHCQCGHNLGLVPYPLDPDYVHSQNCIWLCCEMPWQSKSCGEGTTSNTSGPQKVFDFL